MDLWQKGLDCSARSLDRYSLEAYTMKLVLVVKNINLLMVTIMNLIVNEEGLIQIDSCKFIRGTSIPHGSQDATVRRGREWV